MRFQDLFHSPPGVLFAFPSRYWFTIGRLRVFSLGGWSPHLQTGFLVSRPTQKQIIFLPVQDYHLLSSAFPCCSGSLLSIIRLVRVRSPLLAESRLISFPLGTKMFQFPRFAPLTYVFSYRYRIIRWVAPFRHSRIKDCSHLPATFRRVPRLSSPLIAKASTRCP